MFSSWSISILVVIINLQSTLENESLGFIKKTTVLVLDLEHGKEKAVVRSLTRLAS